MFFRLILLFTLVPFVELYLLFYVGARIGLLATLGVILFTGFLGAVLARQEGLRTLSAAQRAMQEGRMPTDEMIEGLMILLAAGVLLTPGFLTDITGFLLLVPSVRAVVREMLKRRFKDKLSVVTYGPGADFMGQGQDFPHPDEPGFNDLDDDSHPGSRKPDIVVEPEDGEDKGS